MVREKPPFRCASSSPERGAFMRWLRTLTVAAALVATVASCQATFPSPCGLLSVEEIENEIGTQFGLANGDEYLDSDGRLCVWIPEPSDPNTYPVWLSIHQFRSSDWEAIRAIDGSRPVPGLAEEAYFVPGPGEEADYDPFGPGIHVRQRGLQLTLLHRGAGGENEMQQIVVELARLAVAQMSTEATVTPPLEAPPGGDR
jgi:hypothetical protein